MKGAVSAGYGLADKSLKARAGFELFLDEHRKYGVGLEVYKDIDHFRDGQVHDNTSNLFSALFYKIDYFDYYYTKGFNFNLEGTPFRNLSIGIGYRNEDQTSASRRTNYSVFSKERTFEENPPVKAGTLRSVWLKGRYGDEPLPIPIIPRNYVQWNIEHTAPAIGSSFDYTQFSVEAEFHVAAYLRSLFLPPSLTFMVSSGTALGALPPQRYYHLDSPLLGYAPIGVLRTARMKEFSGDTYFIMSVEHNLRNVPFLWLNIPFLYKNSVELITFVNIAQTWSSANSAPVTIHPSNGIVAEAGIGISRILGLFRVDFTYRLTDPQRFVVTMGIAMLL